MVTHQTHLLSSANRIIVMEKGSAVFDGSYIELLQSELDLTDIEVSFGVVTKADKGPTEGAPKAKSGKQADKKIKQDVSPEQSSTDVYMEYVRVSNSILYLFCSTYILHDVGLWRYYVDICILTYCTSLGNRSLC